MENLVNQGVVPALVVILFVLVDKVIVPLVKRKTDGNGSEDRNGSRNYRDSRIERLEDDMRKLRETVSAIGTAVEVSQAILNRIEASLNEKTKR